MSESCSLVVPVSRRAKTLLRSDTTPRTDELGSCMRASVNAPTATTVPSRRFSAPILQSKRKRVVLIDNSQRRLSDSSSKRRKEILQQHFNSSHFGRKTCHFCGHKYADDSGNVYCSSVYCDKTSSHASFMCSICIVKQQTYFQGLGVDYRCVLGDMESPNWYCLDCIIHDFPQVGLGLCCCSFRRHKFKCPLHPDQGPGSSVHCHTYRRKNALQLVDISSVVDVRKIRVPNFGVSVSTRRKNRYRQLLPCDDAALLMQMMRPGFKQPTSTSVSLALFKSGGAMKRRGRRTCHFCGKEQKGAGNIYCSNVYCDKSTGQAQFICGGCIHKQRQYMSKHGISFENVFGDVEASNWTCLDCCINDFAPVRIGSCCCSFRRKKFKCPLHPKETPGRRIHCHTYYQKLPKQYNGLKDCPDSVDVRNMHVCWNEDRREFDPKLRSFLVEKQPTAAPASLTPSQPSSPLTTPMAPLPQRWPMTSLPAVEAKNLQWHQRGTEQHLQLRPQQALAFAPLLVAGAQNTAFTLRGCRSPQAQAQADAYTSLPASAVLERSQSTRRAWLLGFMCSPIYDSLLDYERFSVSNSFRNVRSGHGRAQLFYSGLELSALRRSLLQEMPFILHIVGARPGGDGRHRLGRGLSLHLNHRTTAGVDSVLQVYDGAGMWHNLAGHELARCLNKCSSSCRPELVYLSACRTLETARALLKAGVLFCVCWSTRSYVGARSSLASAFYSALAAQTDVYVAFESARVAARNCGWLEGDPDTSVGVHGVPLLLTSADPRFIQQTTFSMAAAAAAAAATTTTTTTTAAAASASTCEKLTSGFSM